MKGGNTMDNKYLIGWKSILATGIAVSLVVLAAKTPFDKVDTVINRLIDTISIKQIASK